MNSSIIHQVVETNAVSEPLHPYYRIYFYIMLISDIFTNSILVIFYRKPIQRLVPMFRYILLHAIATSGLLIITIVLWQPIALAPLLGGYCLGVIQVLGQYGFIIGLWIVLTCMSQLGVIFMCAFVMQSYYLKV
jgi:hypothetical protein